VKLIRLEGRAASDEFDVESAQAIIGRAPDCDVVLFDPQVSRRHARLREDGPDYFIEDLQEANPTILNDRVLDGSRHLKDGDLIIVGGVVLLVELILPTQRAELLADPVTEPEEIRTDRSTISISRASHVRPVPSARASEVGQSIARRLDAAARRLQARASALASSQHPERAGDIAALDEIIVGHEHLGGDEQLARLAGLLHERMSNQTDIRALYRLGGETQALLAWTDLAQRSIAEASNLATWLELR
jgi:hypothetical protein